MYRNPEEMQERKNTVFKLWKRGFPAKIIQARTGFGRETIRQIILSHKNRDNTQKAA